MKLNTHSYVHKQIRALCFLFEQETGLHLVTDLSENFDVVRFCSPYSYVTIDYQHSTLFVMCIKLTKKEMQIIEDILLYLAWLNTGEEIQKKFAKF